MFLWAGLSCFVLGILSLYFTEQAWVLAVPFLILIGISGILYYESLFFIMIALIPLSTELEFGGGVMINFPIEIFMIVLTGIFLLIMIYRPQEFNTLKFLHPISVLLLIHLAWMVLCTFFTENTLVSVKFLLAKTWFVGSFFFMSLWMIRSDRIVAMVQWLMIPLILSVLVVVIRHGLQGFSFDSINDVLDPFYRNHVNYSALLAISFPFFFYLLKTNQWVKWCLGLFLLSAVYFSYTRAAYIALFAGMAYFLVVRYRLSTFLSILAIAVASYFVFDLIRDHAYLDYAPDYKKTIAHKNFDDLIEATYEFQDVSTMERVHRWVAGFHMIGERPWTGFGPAGFYESYKNHTVNSFKTYISDNKEHSGIHSYYLMTAVEQGIPGLIIYLILIFATLIVGEKAYHRLEDPKDRQMCLAAISALVIIHIFQLINDLVEADKVGPLFFFSTAIVIYLDLKSRKQKLTH
jgi:O-antigen ligase